ncbi:hypothetical protein MO973_07365 [Paenibacillus sp. TRM 82003]|nr:hypothetical protein [Paenibacillus sp. TRM 82003]
MHCEYPIREEHVQPFLRRRVGVVLLDGTCHYGVIERCEKGCLVLKPFAAAGAAEEAEVESIRKPAKRRRTKKSKTKAVLPPAGPGPFGPVPFGPPPVPPVPPVPPAPAFGAPLTLGLTSIALLFALLP